VGGGEPIIGVARYGCREGEGVIRRSASETRSARRGRAGGGGLASRLLGPPCTAEGRVCAGGEKSRLGCLTECRNGKIFKSGGDTSAPEFVG